MGAGYLALCSSRELGILEGTPMEKPFHILLGRAGKCKDPFSWAGRARARHKSLSLLVAAASSKIKTLARFPW